MLLFHYHFWTPHLEETEKFYVENGFRTSLRTGKYQGEYQTFNPPLEWDDFRNKPITFRIIEVRRGAMNITFGFGKKVMFDHIGFLVTKKEKELDKICHNARSMNWPVNTNDRRTFIGTPYGFRIELQSNADSIDGTRSSEKMEGLELILKKEGFERDLSKLLNSPVHFIRSKIGETPTISKAVMSGILISNQKDPNGVNVIGKVGETN